MVGIVRQDAIFSFLFDLLFTIVNHWSLFDCLCKLVNLWCRKRPMTIVMRYRTKQKPITAK